MKIALISSHSFASPGGVKNHVIGLHNEFSRRGIASKIIAPRRDGSENYGRNVILLGTSFAVPFGGAKGDLAINFDPFAIQDVLKKEKFDVLHFHNFILPSALEFLMTPAAAKTTNILTYHSSMEESRLYRELPEIFYPVKKIIEWRIHGIIGVASFILDKYFADFKGPKVHIPNGVDTQIFNPAGKKITAIKKDPRTKILFLGRLDKRKGLIYLLYAWRALKPKYRDIALYVAGDGPERKRCEDFAQKNNLSNVIFLGMVKEKDAPAYYRSGDIFCSPAVGGESFGVILIEAMASGLPVVAFANEGYRQVLNHGAGREFMVEPKNWRELARKIGQLVGNPELRGRLGQWGLNESQKYSWPVIADRVLQFYKKCVKK